MPYVRKPFNPLTPTPNQVITELNQANENFDILAQAFVSNNPETFIVKNADKVDGFHASTIPTPNTIPVAGADGKIALDWLPDSVLGGSGGGGFRRIDMTNATSDYDLQVGEEAYYEWESYPDTSLPLRITVSGSLYEMIIVNRRTTLRGKSDILLLPNNAAYFTPLNMVIHNIAQFKEGIIDSVITDEPFFRFKFGEIIAYTSFIYAIINTKCKGAFSIILEYSTHFQPIFRLVSQYWRSRVSWTLLGTLFNFCDNCPENKYSYPPDYLSIIVRRLV